MMLDIQIRECPNCFAAYSTELNECPRCTAPFYWIPDKAIETPQKGLSAQNSAKVSCDGYQFDSTLEYKRYEVLKLRALANEIQGLQVHPKFVLMPKIKGVVSAITYEADFSYMHYENEGTFIVEDTKAVYGNTKKNRAKGIAGKPIIKVDARLRHKLLITQLWNQYGDEAKFRIVTDISE